MRNTEDPCLSWVDWRGGWFGCVFVFGWKGELSEWRGIRIGVKIIRIGVKNIVGVILSIINDEKEIIREKIRKIQKSLIPKNSHASIPYSKRSVNWILNFERSANMILSSEIYNIVTGVEGILHKNSSVILS